MKKTKIDWVTTSNNCVYGCKNNCPYCYARKINDRFHFCKDWNKPEFHREKLKELECKKPQTIFMNSMSDIEYWDKDWVYQTCCQMNYNHQHRYIFLTKNLSGSCDNGIGELINCRDLMPLKKNVFIGKTINFNNQFNCSEFWDFLSIEPILEPIDLSTIKYSLYTKQVIIGAETGNRKGKVIPQKEWIDNIVKQCDGANVRVFMKSSLKEIMGNDFRQDKLIWDLEDKK